MRWLLRSRTISRLGTLVLATIVLACAMVNRLVPVPSLGSAPGLGLPAAIATPVVASVLILAGSFSANPRLELSAARALRTIEISMVLAASLISGGLLVVAALLLDNPLLVAGARNLVGMVGVGMVMRRWFDPAHMTVIVIGYAAVNFSLGNRLRPQPWAWLLEPPTSLHSWITALGIAAVGIWIGTSHAARQRGA